MDTIKRNIKKFRELANYSQHYVAGKLGITQQAYQQIESGDTRIEAGILIRLADILHVQVEQFYGTEAVPGNKSQMETGEKQLYEMLLASKNELIASKDKVIELQERMLAGKGRKG